MITKEKLTLKEFLLDATDRLSEDERLEIAQKIMQLSSLLHDSKEADRIASAIFVYKLKQDKKNA